MKEPIIIALDIGTQSTRAGAVTVDGDILGIVQVTHEVDSPHVGWAQQQPGQWWDEIGKAIPQLFDETALPTSRIAAVATCGQMHGPVGVDEYGSVTTQWVQLWCDKRCADQCEDLRQRSDETALTEITGSAVNPAWSGLKVRWHVDHQPDVYHRTRWFLVPKDFVNYRLTGVAAADPSEASGSFLYDCRTDAYSPQLAEAVGVDLQKFAPLHASHDVIGHVTETAAKHTGLLAGTPVVAGGGDFPVSMLGFGIVGDGVTADVTGTSTLLASHSRAPLIDPGVQNLRHVVKGWVPFTILDTGGLSVKWWRDLIAAMTGQDVEYTRVIELASQAPPGCDGLMFYPYMLGERRRENTTARGGFFGVTLNHSAAHFARAVMEGVALAMGKDVELFRKLGHEVNRLHCVGGGTRNELWNQIKSDVTQTQLDLSDEPEAGLKGAALLGAAGAGLVADLADAARARRCVSRTIQPQPDSFDAYRLSLDEFKRVYRHMLGFWADRP